MPQADDDRPPPERWKCTVTSCVFKTVFMRGTDEVPIYEVEAVDESGAIIDKKLRSFEELPIGELRNYNVSLYQHPRFGVVHTLRKPRAGSALGPKVDNLRERVESLEGLVERVEKLERQMNWVLEQHREDSASPRSETQPAPAASAPAGPDF